jgi:hypothetical protein
MGRSWITCWEMYDLITEEVAVQVLIRRSRCDKEVIENIWVLRRIYPYEVVSSWVFLKCFTYHISMSSIDLLKLYRVKAYWNPFEKELVLVEEIVLSTILRLASISIFTLHVRLRISLSWLILLSPHNVLHSVLHLGQVVSSSIELLNANQVESVNY